MNLVTANVLRHLAWQIAAAAITAAVAAIAKVDYRRSASTRRSPRAPPR